MRHKRSGKLAKEKREELGLTLEDLAEALGATHGYLSMWESGKRVLSDRLLRRVSERLNLNFEELRELAEIERYAREQKRISKKYDGRVQSTGKQDIERRESTSIPSLEDMVLIPILGAVPSKAPTRLEPIAMDTARSFMTLPEHLIAFVSDSFAIMVKGDSMKGRVEDGDMIVVQMELMPQNGDMAVVRLGDEFMLKAIEFINGIVLLRSTNPNVPTVHVTEREKDDFEIVGKVIISIIQSP